ncbi:MAG: polysaccharide pyruvyl transferase family protein [Flavobacteriales bacterium]|jgi:hypothetical protein|nr:polysaccharide pyruvyl transferase family protein [Flavobacteriales bacterium]|tara:strand:+ start:543 stop:1688 length:1146 start_codon:yes stop_codon:yes gene_type:complete
MKDQYVILTGSKNNAGDYLIKYRAKQLFSEIRPDRKIIDLNAYEKLSKEKLEVINSSKALILMGGPALVRNMVPKVYPLTGNIDDIKVPIIMMGIGWKSQQGNWKDTYNYSLGVKDLELLRKIDSFGFQSSVRDYHTLNSLRFNGFENFLMTGCPAYYDSNFINTYFRPYEVKKVAFSLGVSFMKSTSMERLMKENILACKKRYIDREFEVVFHHSLDRDNYKVVDNSSLRHVNTHIKFTQWLKKHGISYVDISGSAENLMNYYSKVDLHIGYRVHAHIFMNSIAKKSILISEDGRGKGVKGAIGGIVLDGYLGFKNGIISRVLNRILPSYDRFYSNKFLIKELYYEADYEKTINFTRLKEARNRIDHNYLIMKQFLIQLP